MSLKATGGEEHGTDTSQCVAVCQPPPQLEGPGRSYPHQSYRLAGPCFVYFYLLRVMWDVGWARQKKKHDIQ